ncbi:MAG TPA: Wadjet anti-phage system protein JetD domain-containing protein [Pantanalinema sp.]
MNALTPADIKARARKLWDGGRFLQAWLAGEAFFPVEIGLRPPSGAEVLSRFAEVRRWIEDLGAQSKESTGHGYRIVDQVVQHRQLGAQRIPQKALIETEADFLRLVAKQQAFSRFRAIAQETRDRLPALEAFLDARPMIALEHAEEWSRLLTVCAYFQRNPRPGLYLRQLDIEGVDTKFIERHTVLIDELLARVLPPDAWDETVKGVRRQDFERRHGLRSEEPLVRFRILDERLALGGMTDVSVPLSDFARLALGVERVFVTENKTNGLCFPAVPRALVVFGLGYGIRSLSEVPWLEGVAIHYWGDIDTHGFAILSQLRSIFPHVQSMLMDRETLLAHKSLWGKEPADKRFTGELDCLFPEEKELFRALRDDAIADRVRLEQERVPFVNLERALLQRGLG